ncbi:MAG: CinA family nicotinamide mononucleotide deamidase-related protein [Proteobacteria bacterium]|nr:CinA family nicotinamide mononucleotide deamidase-related protein [Pseudomonadota bacterium]
MIIGILTIGNELTSGRIQDTNSSMIARAMQVQGWPVAGIVSVGDDAGVIRAALDYLLMRAEAVILTGGLGPTADDITTEAVARAFGLALRTDEAILAHIRGIFEKRRLAWTENNAKQALFPEGAEIMANPAGTAAGFALRREGRVVAVIPGVPAEALRMLEEGVIPLLRREFPEAALHAETATFKLFGLPEAAVGAAMADANLADLGVAIGFYPNFPENHLVLTARTASAEEAGEKLREAGVRVEARLGKYIFARGQETLAGNIAGLMTERRLTLAVAESCTGGLITDRLTDIPGSSVFLERGVVTYSNAAKTALLGVPEPVIREHGAVSAETARLMAEGVRNMAATDLGLAVTGIAGPSGGTESKPVGTVYIALADGGMIACRHHAFHWERRRNKIVASQAALLILWRYLTGEVNS